MLIPRENIIVFGENLKLGINLKRTIVIVFIIIELFEISPVVFPFKRKNFPCKSFVSCACYLFSHPTDFRNKVLFPTSGIRVRFEKER